MKKIICAATLSMMLSPVMAAPATQGTLSSDLDKLSYTLGADMGSNFKAQDIKIEPNVFLKGLNDALSGTTLQMKPEEMRKTLQAFQQQLIAKRLQKFKSEAETNKKAGEAFLAANKAKQGVKTLPSGLQYKVLSQGTGPSPAKTDSVTVEYTGTLINGKVFDSSKRAGKPATFKLTQVIPGWTEALQLMKQGATWEIYVPPKLAYGERGIGGPIGPNQTLIFKIHLLSVNKQST